MKLRDEHWSILLCTVVALATLSPITSSAAYDPKADGKEFAKTVLVPKGEGVSKDEAAPKEVPLFTDTPPGKSYADDPVAMEADAVVAKGSNEGYNAMIDSMGKRATFSKSDLEATTKFGKDVIADPGAYSGTAISGTPGTCTAIPKPLASPGFYEQTCNTGYTETGGGPVTCNIAAKVVVQTVVRHECSILDPGFNGTDDCGLIDPYWGSICQLVGSREGKCLQWAGVPPFEFCVEPGEPIQQYDCMAPVPGATIISSIKQLISAGPDPDACKSLDDNPSCSIMGPDVCVDDDPVTRIVDGLAVTLPCWAWTREYDCGGAMVLQTDCDQLDGLGCVFDREVCLTEDDPCMTMEQIYRCPIPPAPQPKDSFICEGDVYCIDGSCDTIEREANTEFKDALAGLNALAQAGAEFDETDFTVFNGTPRACTKLIFGLKNCCVPRGIPLIGGCTGEDTILKDQREQGLCTYVGTWCSDKFIVCLAKKERHCCFASKITRIIQEQGREQLGIPWDKPEDETCRGFTVEEFSLLDLSVMDFSEVYADFEAAAQLPAELDVLDEMKTKIEAYYAVHG